MGYENRENGGRTEQEIQKDLKDTIGHGSTVGELYKAGINLIDRYLNQIRRDEQISDRLDTSNNNKLLAYKNALEETINDYQRNQPGMLASKMREKKDSIALLAKHIDNHENTTLRNLKVRGGFVYMKMAQEKQRKEFGKEPFTLYNNGKIQIEEGLDNHNLQDISSIFNFSGTVQEFYSGHMPLYDPIFGDTRTEEEKDIYDRAYTHMNKCEKTFTCWVPEGSQAFNVIKGLVEGKIPNLLDEVVVLGKRRKRRGETDGGFQEIHDPTQDSSEDKINNRPFDGTFTLRYNGEINGKITYEIQFDGFSYILKDASKIPLSKGMTIQESDVLQAYSETRIEVENKKKLEVTRESELSNPETDPNLVEYTYNIPERLKNKIKEKSHELAYGDPNKEYAFYNEFVYKTEDHIKNITKVAKELKREPMEPTFTKRSLQSTGMMEYHFRDKNNNEVEEAFWNRGTQEIPYEMYDLIDSNEGDYKIFLNESFKKIRETADFLTQYENQETTPRGVEDQLDKETIQTMKEGLKLFSMYIDNCRVDEGHSRDDDDIRLKDIKSSIKQELYNLNNLKQNQLSKAAIEERTINKISKIYSHLGINSTSENDPWVKEQVTKILYDTSNLQKVRAIFDLNSTYGIIGNDPSLVESLIRQEAFASADLNMVDYAGKDTSEYFRNFNKLFDIKDGDYEYDENGNLIPNEYTKNIDEIYSRIKGKDRKKAGEIIKDILVEKGALTKKWHVEKQCEDIAETLNKVYDNFVTIDSVREQLKNRRNQLISSGGSEGSKELNMINNLLNDEKTDEYLKVIADKSNDQLKYGSVQGIMRNNLIEAYADHSYAMCIGDSSTFHTRWELTKDRKVSDMVNDNIRGRYTFKLKDKDVYAIKKFCLEQGVALLVTVGVGELVSLAVSGVIKGVKAAKYAENLLKGFEKVKGTVVTGKKSQLIDRSVQFSSRKYLEKGLTETISDKITKNTWADEPYSINNLTACVLSPVLKGGMSKLNRKYNLFYKMKYETIQVPIIKENVQVFPLIWNVGSNIGSNGLGAFLGGMIVSNDRSIFKPDEHTQFRVPTEKEQETALIGFTKFALENRQNNTPNWDKLEDKINNGNLTVFPGENGEEIYLGNVDEGKMEPLSNRENLLA